jgi:histidinol-phosphate/aromatic aminotransferase/cobyric acid decarboxylase-like protein
MAQSDRDSDFERQRLIAEVRKRLGVRTFRIGRQFHLIRTAKIGSELFNELYSQGVLVRDVSSYPMLERVLARGCGTRNKTTSSGGAGQHCPRK